MHAASPGLGLAAALTLVARPVAVALCLLPFRYSFRETLFIGIVGLRGAVPVVLATVPVIAGVRGARWIFDVVFFIVVVNTLIPGAAVAWLARRLRVVAPAPPEPTATVVVESSTPLRGDLRTYFIDQVLPVCGETLAEIPFPEGTAVTMIVRGSDLIAADGATRLQPGDHVYVLAKPESAAIVQLLLGDPEPVS
jgi:cell volume regulation protein A